MFKYLTLTLTLLALTVTGVVRNGIPQTSLAAGYLPAPQEAASKTLTFSGYQWDVRSGTGGPGPNKWSDANAWVDSNGYLHLKISARGGRWYCSEVVTQQKLGFGTYTFQVVGQIDKFDRNVVLGLFNYPTPDVGPDTTNEIDIEIARWGNPKYPNGNYTVWPAQTGFSPTTYTFPFTLTSKNSTHSFAWNSQGVSFQSFYGLTTDLSARFGNWSFTPADYLNTVPQNAMPLHINLWLMQGRKPVNGKQVEIVIKSFTFTP